jgi:hypothetical protein
LPILHCRYIARDCPITQNAILIVPSSEFKIQGGPAILSIFLLEVLVGGFLPLFWLREMKNTS